MSTQQGISSFIFCLPFVLITVRDVISVVFARLRGVSERGTRTEKNERKTLEKLFYLTFVLPDFWIKGDG